jgi:hypothetical protein
MRFIDVKDCFDFSERGSREGRDKCWWGGTEGEIIGLEKICCGVKWCRYGVGHEVWVVYTIGKVMV